MPAPDRPTLADWRAQVEKELGGAPFERLVQRTAEGLALQPLYTDPGPDPGLPGAAPFVRGALAPGEARPFGICMRVDPPAARRAGALAEDVDGGADALWFAHDDAEALEAAIRGGLQVIIDDPTRPTRIEDLEAWQVRSEALAERLAKLGGARPHAAWYAHDYVDDAARGALPAPPMGFPRFLEALGRVHAISAKVIAERGELAGYRRFRVSGLTFHRAGADAADELALMLASAATYLRALVENGLSVDLAARSLWAQIAIGRDTFGELCKLRALRLCWHKLLAAAGAADTRLDALHAVCSPRTQAQRDPWVNMLRVTTQVFAAALGGATLVTPLAYDEALGAPSALGRRIARNAALVLREESQLGRVIDPAGGSYYVEARTDALAREAWSRFTAIERAGGIVPLLASGELRARLGAAWDQRAAAIARRKEPVLGVSEFANLGEQLPAAPPPPAPPPPAPALVPHRDGEAFEALRARVEAGPRVDVALITLGPPAEHRARAGYAAAFFAAAGLTVRESDTPARADVACMCGSDERYAAEAADTARALREAGCGRVVLAGRPGALEPALREAGVDTFLFVGCDVLATLTDLAGGAA